MDRRTCLVLVAAFACGGAVGCGPDADTVLNNDLKQTGLAILLHQDQHKRLPKDWDELLKFAKDAQLSAQSIQRVRDAGYTVEWAVDLEDEKVPNDQKVLAKKAGGTWTLYGDGSVRGGK